MLYPPSASPVVDRVQLIDDPRTKQFVVRHHWLWPTRVLAAGNFAGAGVVSRCARRDKHASASLREAWVVSPAAVLGAGSVVPSCSIYWRWSVAALL